MLRKFLHLYLRLSRGMTLGVRGAVLDGDGRIFLVRHGYVSGWHFPGGGVEPGESLGRALARELEEEGNIRITGTPLLHGVFQNTGAASRDHIALFVVRQFDCLGPPRLGWEIVEAGFFRLDRLPEGTSAGTRRRLEEILTGAPVSASW
jgi:8-oxo-dGTP pyrophosphatase MutT (NUDIX family)